MANQNNWNDLYERTDLSDLDKGDRFLIRALQNAEKDPGPFISSQILCDSKKRAKKNSWAFDLDREYLVRLWKKQQGKCAVTGAVLTGKPGSRQSKNPYRASLDRINNGKGYVKGNVRFVSHWYNNAKSTWPDKIFDEFVGHLVEMRRG